MSITIRRGVPVPPIRRAIYPWRELNVGDSFLVEGGDNRTLGALASSAGKRLGWRFTVRKTPEGVVVGRLE